MSFIALCHIKGAAMSIFYQNRTDSFYFFTSSNNTYPAHLHRQIELLVVLEGSLIVTADHEQYNIEADSGIIIFPNQLHSLCTKNYSKILLCIFDREFCHSYQNIFQKGRLKNPVFNLNHLTPHGRISIDGLLALTAHWSKGKPIPKPTLALSEGYLTLLLAAIFTNIELEFINTSSDLKLEQNILLYIESHYRENISLEVLSKEFGISRFRLSRLFSQKLHTTFPGYVNSKRLEYAKDRLDSTNLSVTQIAFDAGFGSSRSLFREFQNYYGMTPGEYRKGLSTAHP